MDDWRSVLPETDRNLLDQYEAAGAQVRWRERKNAYTGHAQMTLEAWMGDRRVAASDTVPPSSAPEVIQDCTRQLLIRLRTYFRTNAP